MGSRRCGRSSLQKGYELKVEGAGAGAGIGRQAAQEDPWTAPTGSGGRGCRALGRRPGAVVSGPARRTTDALAAQDVDGLPLGFNDRVGRRGLSSPVAGSAPGGARRGEEFMEKHCWRVLSLVVISAAFDVGCSVHARREQGLAPRCPPQWTLVPVKRAATPAFLPEIEGCEIAVDAVFHGPFNRLMTAPSEYDDRIRLTLTDENGISGGMSFSDTVLGALAGKEMAGTVFSLRRGDRVRVLGTLVAERFTGGLAHIWIVARHLEKR